MKSRIGDHSLDILAVSDITDSHSAPSLPVESWLIKHARPSLRHHVPALRHVGVRRG